MPDSYHPFFDREEQFLDGYGFFVPEGLELREDRATQKTFGFGSNVLECLVVRRQGPMLDARDAVYEDDGRTYAFLGNARVRMPDRAVIEPVTIHGVSFHKITPPALGDRGQVLYTGFDGDRCVTFRLTYPTRGDEVERRRAVLEAAVLTCRFEPAARLEP